jgi:hypothetical protein
MSPRFTSFADLLNPVRSDALFQTNWEKEPLHVRRSQPDFYAALLTSDDVEATISSGGLRYPAHTTRPRWRVLSARGFYAEPSLRR